MTDIAKLNEPVAQEVSSPTRQDDSEQKDSEPPARGGTYVKVPSAPKYEGNPTENEQKPYRWRELILKYLPHVIAALALGISVSSQNASWESARNSKRSAGAAEQSAAAAQRNADIAEQALTAAVERDHRDQRAWVGPSKFHVPKVVPGTDVSFCVEVTNIGKTPATQFGGVISGLIQSTGPPFFPVYAYGPLTKPIPSVTPLFPGAMRCLETGAIKFNPMVMEFLESGRGTLYVYGMVGYDDVFGGSHCTRFCVLLSRDLKNFQVCPTYNTITDTKCDEQ